MLKKQLGLALLFAAVPGCITFSTPRQRVDGIDGELIVGDYDGPECFEVFHAKDASSYTTLPSDDFDHHVMLAACSWGRRGPPKIHPRYARDAHLSFDDRRLSHTIAGEMVWACTLSKTCAQSFKPKYGPMLAFSEGSTGDPIEDLGLAAVYANIVDTAKIRSELQARGLPAAAIEAFVGVVERAKTHVLDKAKELGALTEVAVDLPLAIHRERQAFFSDHAEEFQTLDGLEGSLDDPGTPAKLETLRSEHMSSCGTFSCVSDPLYAEATVLLIKSYIARKDLVSAYAENHRLTRDGGYTAGFAQAVYERQAPAAAKARAAFDKAEKAKSTGLDSATIDAAIDVTPARFTFSSIAKPKLFLPNYTEVLGDPPRKESGFVQRVQAGGETAVVSFKPSQIETLEPYGCVETNRIERITSDGRIEYRTRCNYRKKMVSHPGPDPVTLPAAEVSSVKKGDLLSFFRGDDAGRVYEVTRGDDLVQVRADPIEPVCRTRKCLDEADGTGS